MPPLRCSHADGIWNNMPGIMLKSDNVRKEKKTNRHQLVSPRHLARSFPQQPIDQTLVLLANDKFRPRGMVALRITF